jgi:hypothetical protein
VIDVGAAKYTRALSCDPLWGRANFVNCGHCAANYAAPLSSELP